MKPYYEDERSGVVLYHGDCLEVLKTLPDVSVDSVVTDPPYGLSREPNIAEVVTHWLAGDRYDHTSAGFMGRSWDSFVPGPEYWREVARVMKPGAHLLAFAGTRTWDLLSIAIRFAGLENRDTVRCDGPPALGWIHAQGFPKGLNVGLAIDAHLGATSEKVATHPQKGAKFKTAQVTIDNGGFNDPERREFAVKRPASAEGRAWDGWNVALKPAWEVILCFRKPLGGELIRTVELTSEVLTTWEVARGDCDG